MFLDLFPKARFISLYRHCMDVASSVLEACPWGLSGYGLDEYVAAHPGNSIAAAVDYWVSHTRTIRAFEKAHPQVCLGVRYEDLVNDPEGQADRIFDFLGEDRVPGIEVLAFRQRQEMPGPADHKIGATSGVHAESVGEGERLPVSAISPPILAMVNEILPI